MSPAGFSLSILKSLAEIEPLREEWDALPQACASPLLSHGWFAAAAGTLCEEGDLHFLALRRGGCLAAIAPLARTRRRGVLRLDIAGADVLHEPSGLLAVDELSADALCAALVQLGRPWALHRVPVQSHLRQRLKAAAGAGSLLFTAASAPCHRVDLAGSWDAYLGGRSADARAGMRRKRAILQRQGAVRFEFHSPGPQEVERVLDEAFEVEADGWKSERGSALRLRPRLGAFVRELARRFAAAGRLRIAFLRAGERAVAMAILLEHALALWEVKIGYRESAAHGSPGRVLLWEVLREGFARGLRAYEFLGSGDGQQPQWATSRTELETLVWYPRLPSGLVALCADAAGSLLRRLRR